MKIIKNNSISYKSYYFYRFYYQEKEKTNEYK